MRLCLHPVGVALVSVALLGCETLAGIGDRVLDAGGGGAGGTGGAALACGESGAVTELYSFKIGDAAVQREPWVSAMASGRATVAGTFGVSIDLDPGSFSGTGNLFAATFDASGGIDTTIVVAAEQSRPQVVFDANDEGYLAGTLLGQMNVENVNGFGSTGATDLYLIYVDAAGAPVWAGKYGDDVRQEVGATLMVADRLVVGGGFDGTVQLTCPSGVLQNTGSDLDAFVFELEPQVGCTWRTSFDEGGDERVEALAFDPAGYVLVGGVSRGPSSDSAFLVKLDESTGASEWQQSLVADAGGSVIIRSLAVDPAGEIYATGDFRGSVTFGDETRLGEAVVVAEPGGGDAFVARFSAADGALVWLDVLAGEGSVAARSIVIDPNVRIVVAGDFQGELRAGATTLLSRGGGAAGAIGGGDVFALRYSLAGEPQTPRCFGDESPQRLGNAAVLDLPSDPLVLVGELEGTLSFGETVLEATGTSTDIFVAAIELPEP